MPFAEDSYTGNGSTKEFNISFAYIEESHIKVALDEVATTAFTVDTSTSPKKVVMNTLASETSTQTTTGAPKSGVAVLVFRDTPLNNALVDYTDGSTLIADDLDKSNQQFLFLLQEQDDEQAANIQSTLAGQDAQNKKIINVADPTAAQHAATKNYVDTNFQPLDAELTELATMSSGTASALADLSQAETQILDGATVTTSELNTLDGITASTAELNKLDGVTASTAELNKLDGVTSTTAELNILDGVTATAAEINTLDGITANTAELNKLDGVTASTAEINKLDGLTPTTAELNFVDGVTSAIQNQINGKQPLDAELTELATMPATTASALADLTQAEVQVLDGATLNTAELNRLDGITSSTSELNILDGVTATAAELNVADGITASTAELNQLDGKTISSTLTPANTNDIPTSSAVNTFVSGLLNALGGFVAIANENSFPTTNPDPSDNAGTVVSIADAGGMSVNSSGVGSGQTTAGTAVTITGFPSTFNGTTIQAGLGLQVQTTSTLNTYTYHKVYAKDEDVRQLSQDVDDFKARYRVGDSNPTTDLDSGDLFFNRGTGKMLVYNGQNTAWEEVQSIGEFFINTLSASTSTGGGSATFNGTAYRFTLSNAPTNAEQLLVSVNGVVQKPNSGTSQPSEGFAIDGSDIIFAAAPATSAPFFIVTIGSAVNIGTPSAGTVGTAQLATSAVTNDKISSTAAIASSKLAKPIDFADNEKARFGTGNDLEIYHDGSNSYIKEGAGTGNLRIEANDLRLKNGSGTEDYIKCNQNAQVELYYNGAKKLETKSDGIDVTGEVQCDSLDVDGNTDVSGQISTSDRFDSNRTTGSDSVFNGRLNNTVTTSIKADGSATFDGTHTAKTHFSVISSAVTNPSNYNALLVDYLGTTKASVKADGTAYFDGNLGIGDSNPGQRLNISIGGDQTWAQINKSRAANEPMLQLIHSAGNRDAKIRFANSQGSWSVGIDGAENLVFKSGEGTTGGGGTTRMRILSNGGLTFGGDDTAVNALNDYEEGTFTPTYASGVTNPGYQTQEGSYTKIGNLVTFVIEIRANSGTENSSHLGIGGLPYTSSNTKDQGGGFFNYRHNLAGGSTNVYLHVPKNNSILYFYTEAGSIWDGNDGNGILNRNLHIQGFYYT